LGKRSEERCEEKDEDATPWMQKREKQSGGIEPARTILIEAYRGEVWEEHVGKCYSVEKGYGEKEEYYTNQRILRQGEKDDLPTTKRGVSKRWDQVKGKKSGGQSRPTAKRNLPQGKTVTMQILQQTRKKKTPET